MIVSPCLLSLHMLSLDLHTTYIFKIDNQTAFLQPIYNLIEKQTINKFIIPLALHSALVIEDLIKLNKSNK